MSTFPTHYINVVKDQFHQSAVLISSAVNTAKSHWSFLTTCGTVIGTSIKFGPIVKKRYRAISDRLFLKKRIGAELYTLEDLLKATECYIEPECQSIDPSGSEDFRKIVTVREGAHATLEKILDPKSSQRFTILLADSGMGKSTLLLNFYVRYCRRTTPRYKVALVPLGVPESDDLIKSVEDKSNTVLLLDAFDEDTKAIADHRARLGEILELSKTFCHVLITCRTQFFERDDEIPKATGIIRIGVTSAGEERVYSFYKIYLSPFSDEKIDFYLNARFPFWKWRARAKARSLAARVPDLTVRPMLLAHIQELLEIGRTYRTSAEIYWAMIDAWLIREKRFVDPVSLKRFSIALAKDIYVHRLVRGSEKIPPGEASKLATSQAIPLQGWQLRGRSLLNRDAEGNLKFSHRTIMEFLFVVSFMTESSHEFLRKLQWNTKADPIEWTDQMKRFWWDLVRTSGNAVHDVELGKAFGDLRGFFHLKTKPLITLRSQPDHFTPEQIQIYVQKVSTINLTYHYCVQHAPSFLEALETKGSEMGVVVIDYVTGLMWESDCRPTTSFTEAEALARNLDKTRFAGFTGWRLPTVEEAMSLLPNDAISTYARKEPSSHFLCWATEIWVLDKTPKNQNYKFSYKSETPATPFSKDLDKEIYVRCVRTHAVD